MNKIIKDSQDHLNEAQLYLDKIPILKQIHGIGDIKQKKDELEIAKPEDRLAIAMELLLKDDHGYYLSSRKNCLQYTDANAKKKTYFFSFYDLTKDWLRSKFQEDQAYNEKLKELKLDEPYKLAIELFKAYIDSRKNATQGAQFQNGINDNKGKYQPNIYDLFTEDDLAKLGGNEFIKDCYTAIGHEELLNQHKLDNKPYIRNIDSRTGEQLQLKEPVKPDLYERVDNHLSWKIFKDGNIKKLNKDEESVLQDAMKNEKFGRYLKKLELKALPIALLSSLLFAVSAALIDMLASGAAFTAVAFISASATIASFSVPILIVFVALVIAPIIAHIMRTSAIVDNMIKISDQNKEFNDKLTKGEEEYKNYRDNNPDFLNPDKKEKEKDEIINQKDKDKEKSINEENIIENKIIPEDNNKDNNLFKQIGNSNNDDLKKEDKEP